MIQLNLLPDVKKQLLHTQMQRNFVISVSIFASIAAGVVVLVLGGIMGGQTIQKNALTDSIAENQTKIAKQQDDNQLDEYLTVQNQLSKISSLKEKQLDYSRVFDYLVELNPASPNNVELTSVKIDAPGSGSSSSKSTSSSGVSVELQGNTASYSSLGVFENTLSLTKFSYAPSENADVQTKSILASVTTNSSSMSSDGLTFSITAVFDEALFDADSVSIKLVIPNETTSDSDRNTPKNVFSNTDSITETQGGQ